MFDRGAGSPWTAQRTARHGHGWLDGLWREQLDAGQVWDSLRGLTDGKMEWSRPSSDELNVRASPKANRTWFADFHEGFSACPGLEQVWGNGGQVLGRCWAGGQVCEERATQQLSNPFPADLNPASSTVRIARRLSSLFSSSPCFRPVAMLRVLMSATVGG